MSSTSNKNTDFFSTVDAAEVEKFTKMADAWWDFDGKFKPLHQLNPIRVEYVLRTVKWHYGKVEGLSVLDVGCGGGLLSEPLARSKLQVTGIDASEKNITIAALHAQKSNLNIDYRTISAEQLLVEKGESQFDVVMAMEVIEHVADVSEFCKAIAALVKPGGLLYIATLNRTLKSFTFAIVGAEYMLRWLPVGTHDWHKFLKPSEIAVPLQQQGVGVQEIQGVSYNPFSKCWCLSNDIGVNYMLRAVKN